MSSTETHTDTLSVVSVPRLGSMNITWVNAHGAATAVHDTHPRERIRREPNSGQANVQGIRRRRGPGTRGLS